MSLNGAFGGTAVWADFDGDGDEDLFAPYYSHIYPYKSFLYRNNGNGTFTDIGDAGRSRPSQPARVAETRGRRRRRLER